MFRIGYRTIKTAVGASLAVLISQWVGLDNEVSAAIITILCIQNTKKKSLVAAWSRLAASIIALLYAFVLFEGIGYHSIVLGVLILLFIPTAVALKIREGIATSCVIILQTFAVHSFTTHFIIQESILISIGIGIGLLMNLYMPSVEHILVDYQKKIEHHFEIILKEIVRFLREKVTDWDGKEITEVAQWLSEAKLLASRDVENHLTKLEYNYYTYFKVRDKQLDILERVLPIITSISHFGHEALLVADFVEELSDHIHPGNTAKFYLEKLSEMKIEFEAMPLPCTHEELNARADLHQLVRELEQYLQIKSSFKK